LKDLDINRGSETTRENIKISAKGNLGHYELRKHKPWFSYGYSKLIDERKQAKLQLATGSKQNKWGKSEQ
jgi:hypothetical protein